MSIFNLTPERVEEVTDKTTVICTNNEGSFSENKELENDSTRVIEEKSNDEGIKRDEKSIVLDGPLGHIYTKALNMIYANESAEMDTKLVFNEAIKEIQGDTEVNEGDNNDLYVLCVDGDNLDADEMVRSSDKLRLALDCKKNKDMLLSIESNGNVNLNTSLLEEFSNKLGVRVCFNRKSALEAIFSALK